MNKKENSQALHSDQTDNNQKEIHTCVDVRLPLNKLNESLYNAHLENPDEIPNPKKLDNRGLRAAMERIKKWKTGRTLQVRFLNGDPDVHSKVVEVAQYWSEFANISFVFNNARDAEIRISFDQPGSWSYLGTDILSIVPDKPTMNFGWLNSGTPSEKVYRVVLHEFGHTLGLIHEHQNPSTSIPWNKDAVYTYYQGPPNYWSKDKVDHNLFSKYAKEKTQYSKFDKYSIMLYPVPKEFTDGVFEVGFNSELSETDKKFISKVYPF